MRYDGHFRLAQELGKHLHEIMGWEGPLTHRQFIVWNAWLNEQNNVPSRSDYYAMQVACEVRRLFNKKPNGVKVDQFKLKFNSTNKVSNEKDKKTKIELAKAAWISRMTAPITVRENGNVVGEVLPPNIKRILEEREARKHGNTNRIRRFSGRDSGESEQVHSNVRRVKHKN